MLPTRSRIMLTRSTIEVMMMIDLVDYYYSIIYAVRCMGIIDCRWKICWPVPIAPSPLTTPLKLSGLLLLSSTLISEYLFDSSGCSPPAEDGISSQSICSLRPFPRLSDRSCNVLFRSPTSHVRSHFSLMPTWPACILSRTCEDQQQFRFRLNVKVNTFQRLEFGLQGWEIFGIKPFVGVDLDGWPQVLLPHFELVWLSP